MADEREDLAVYLDEMDDLPPELPGPDIPPPRDKLDADRMLRRIRRLEDEAAEVQVVAEAEIGPIRAWQHDRLGGIVNLRTRIEKALEGFTRMANTENPRLLSVNLPYGKLKLLQPPGTVEVTDYEAFKAWEHDSIEGRVCEKISDALIASTDLTGEQAHGRDIDITELVALARDIVATVEAERYVRPNGSVNLAMLRATTVVSGNLVEEDEESESFRLLLDDEVLPGVAFRVERFRRFKIAAPDNQPEGKDQ